MDHLKLIKRELDSIASNLDRMKRRKGKITVRWVGPTPTPLQRLAERNSQGNSRTVLQKDYQSPMQRLADKTMGAISR